MHLFVAFGGHGIGVGVAALVGDLVVVQVAQQPGLPFPVGIDVCVDHLLGVLAAQSREDGALEQGQFSRGVARRTCPDGSRFKNCYLHSRSGQQQPGCQAGDARADNNRVVCCIGNERIRCEGTGPVQPK